MRTLADRLPVLCFVAVNGVLHARLWELGYRNIPLIGTLFLVNAIGAAVLALAVAVRPHRFVLFAIAAFSAGSLVSLLASRTSLGVFGYMERGFSTDALAIIAAEIGAIVAVGVVLGGRASLRLARIPVGRTNQR